MQENNLNETILKRFADDEKLYEAVRTELLESLKTKRLDLGLNNDELGAEVRARERAKEMVDEGLKNIRRLKISEVTRETLNPGR